MKSQLIVSGSPHIVTARDTSSLMRDVLIALSPAAVAAVLIFGLRALLLMAVTVGSAILFEFLYERLLHRRSTVSDLSAAVTGLILALNLPATLPIWQAVLGAFISIVIVKQLFGGIGHNFANPAIVARIVLLISFTATMNRFAVRDGVWDLVSSATPLESVLNGDKLSYLTLFLGEHAGSIGETSALALLLGLGYLLVRRVITWHIPVSFVGTVALLSLVGGRDVLLQVLSGGLLLGAIFMATDYVTSPASYLGKLIYGVGCGAITVLIRFFGGAEGVSYAILMMNILTPYIDRLTRRRPFGKAPRAKGGSLK
ncbi:MAG: RnfABCDGE type electron transport complex subunit D [Clostridia bacterium]|nr:RnfABCDGE type electron transport complex subunit D [Clostridia bacterium]